MQNAVSRDIPPCGSYKNRRFRGTYLLHHEGDKIRQARNNSVLRLLVTATVVHRSPILVTLMIETGSSETSVLTRATWRNIPEGVILQ
jgi:hypothetical protein